MFILMFLALNLNLSAQSIKVVEGPNYVEGTMEQEEVVAYGTVKNVTDKSVSFNIRFEVIEIAPEHSLAVCYNKCYDVVNIDYEVPGTFTLAPGQTSQDVGDIFSFHCYPFRKILDDPITYIGPAAGVTKVKIYFTNSADVLDESEYEITFNVKDPTDVDDEPSSSNFQISNVYPNPAKEMTKIEFQYNKEEDFPRVSLYDMKGNKLYDYEVCKCEDFIYLNTKEYANGSYYVQLVGKNRKSKNQLLLIQR